MVGQIAPVYTYGHVCHQGVYLETTSLSKSSLNVLHRRNIHDQGSPSRRSPLLPRLRPFWRRISPPLTKIPKFHHTAHCELLTTQESESNTSQRYSSMGNWKTVPFQTRVFGQSCIQWIAHNSSRKSASRYFGKKSRF